MMKRFLDWLFRRKPIVRGPRVPFQISDELQLEYWKPVTLQAVEFHAVTVWTNEEKQ